MNICGILVCVIENVIRQVKIDKYSDIKNCSCVKRLFGKLALSWEDDILNTI